MDVAIVADDLTGAADAAVEFAGAGRRVAVGLTAVVLDHLDVFAVDVASRERTPQDAAQRVALAVRQLAPRAPERWFKKIDSTLRGNVTAEIGAFQAAASATIVVVAPAFPAQQRRYIGGSLQDGDDPLTSSAVRHHLPTMLAAGGGAPTLLPLPLVRRGVAPVGQYLAAAPAGSLVVADAVDDTDLDVIVAGVETSGRAVAYAGSAGLAAALARARGIVASEPARLCGRREVLFLVGSLQPASRRQLHAAMERFGAAIVVEPDEPPGGLPALRAARQLLTRPPAGGVILATPSNAAGEPLAFAAAITEVAATLILHVGVRRIFVTGGDLARGLCERLGITRLLARGQVLPGIPALTAIDGVPGLNLVTKAGGFGPDDTLLHVYEYLSGEEEQA